MLFFVADLNILSALRLLLDIVEHAINKDAVWLGIISFTPTKEERFWGVNQEKWIASFNKKDILNAVCFNTHASQFLPPILKFRTKIKEIDLGLFPAAF